MFGSANNAANESKRVDDISNTPFEEDKSFLTIPQIKAREFLRTLDYTSKKLDSRYAGENFDNVIKPLVMSSVDFITEADVNSAGIRKYYTDLVTSAHSLARLQHDRDGWRWEIQSSLLGANSSLFTCSNQYYENLRRGCAFPKSHDPHDCFSKFMFSNFLEFTVISSTNRVARSRQRSNTVIETDSWQDLDMKEFMTWIGILELMQIAEPSTGCLQEYWQTNAFNFGTMSIHLNFSAHMSQHRWLQILKCLHFDGDITDLFDAFNQRVEKIVIPGQELTVCNISQFQLNYSNTIEDWMCLCDISSNLMMRLPSSPSKTRHWSEQIRDSNTVLLLGLTQPYHFSLREVFVVSSKCEADAIVQLQKRGIHGILLSDNTPRTLPPFYPVEISQILLPSTHSCLVCDRSFSGTNVRILFQRLSSCAFCTNDSSLNPHGSPNVVSVSDLKDLSKAMAKMSQFKCFIEEHIKSFMKPIRHAAVDSSDFESVDKTSALICILAIVEYNAKKLFDILSSTTDSPLLQFRAKLANTLLNGPTCRILQSNRDKTTDFDSAECKKRRVAHAHRVVRLDNSTAQVQRQCSLACRCENKKGPKDPAPRTSNACSCSPSIPLCSKICHTYHVLSQLDLLSKMNADISK
jgi:hypothetical protein